MTEDIKPFIKVFDKIAYTKSDTEVFNDFLDISICALSAGGYEEEYLLIIKKYKKEEVNLFCELFAQMVILMDADGHGLTDVLGEFYQTRMSSAKRGQYFTPETVSDFMAAIVNPEESEKTILDPACGSGRMLLSAAKLNRNNYFFGADIDHLCCKITTLNLCLNYMQGEIAWMDSLGGHEYHWGGYSITRLYGCVPVIRKLAAGEGIIANSAPFNRKNKGEDATKSTAPVEEKKILPANNTIVIQTKLDL